MEPPDTCAKGHVGMFAVILDAFTKIFASLPLHFPAKQEYSKT